MWMVGTYAVRVMLGFVYIYYINIQLYQEMSNGYGCMHIVVCGCSFLGMSSDITSIMKFI